MVDVSPGEDEKALIVTEIVTSEKQYRLQTRKNGPDKFQVVFDEFKSRHASLRSWLPAELEYVKYGDQHFQPFELEEDVKILRIAIGIYDDDFNAYRGVYHGIGGGCIWGSSICLGAINQLYGTYTQ
jgi:hypothetical protein